MRGASKGTVLRFSMLLLLAAWLFSCGERSLQAVSAAFEVRPERLDFGATTLSFSRELPLEILNRSRVSTDFALQAQPPFEATPREGTIAAGESLAVTVRFSPDVVGAVEGVLGLGTLEVALVGEGRARPDCIVTDDCRTSAFDPESGRCVSTHVADTTPCANACVTSGACHDGQCVGAAVSCDDGDACTLDACATLGGCLHAAVACPAATAPCLAAVCHPESGCATTKVPDGTSCGESSCAVAKICLEGLCVARTPPDGAPCGGNGPCDSAGTCSGGACLGSTTTPLTPIYSRKVAESGLLFNGATDSYGNFYWVECGGGGEVPMSPDPVTCPTGLCGFCRAVSVTRDGLPRFETPLFSSTFARSIPRGETQLVDRGLFIQATSSSVVAFDTVTGVKRWEHAVSSGVAGAETASIDLASDGSEQLWALVDYVFRRAGPTGQSIVAQDLVRIDLSTGALRSGVSLNEARGGGLVVDELGNAFVGTPSLGTSAEDGSARGVANDRAIGAAFRGFGRQGQLLFAVSAPAHNAACAAADGTAYSIGAQYVPIGGPHEALKTMNFTNMNRAAGTLVLDGTAFFVGEDTLPAIPISAGLSSFDPRTGATNTFLAPGVRQFSALLGYGSPSKVLVLHTNDTSEAEALGVLPNGREDFRCVLGSDLLHAPEGCLSEECVKNAKLNVIHPRVAFSDERLAVLHTRGAAWGAPGTHLEIYEVRGLRPALRGWMSRRGTPGQAGRPLSGLWP
jgi:hypothetical protein